MIFIKVNGNLESIKKSVIDELEALYGLDIPKNEFVTEELVLRLAALTVKINREISVFINRKGRILDVSVGNSSTVSLPEVEGRRNTSRLSGVRCIHTHPSGSGQLSPVDINSLLKLRLDAIAAVGAGNNEELEVYAALPNTGLNNAETYGPFFPGDKGLNELLKIIDDIDKPTSDSGINNEEIIERAILVGLETFQDRKLSGKSEAERLLNELEELAKIAGVVVLHKVLQKRDVKDSGYFIGRGLAEQLNLMRQTLDANMIIFDDELSGAQVRNLEEITGIKVIDRTMLILDIFAGRARSREGKLQVELAQLKYRLPRLIGLGNQLSRLGGGIGTRGPGEKKLEVDRRHIKRRIGYLEQELEALGKRRELMRKGRKKNTVPTVALVGYTNAGKSTLMNILCKSDVFAENRLFATLDPTTRSFELPGGRNILLTDTVGFIRKLPHDLIEAFKSTLEEAVFADALLHVVDASSEDYESQINVVNSILEGLGAINKPVIIVFNKIDLTGGKLRMPYAGYGQKIYEVSSVTGEGLDMLKKGILEILPIDEVQVELDIPYSEGWVLPFLHKNGKVLKEEFMESGIKVSAKIKKASSERIEEFVVKIN